MRINSRVSAANPSREQEEIDHHSLRLSSSSTWNRNFEFARWTRFRRFDEALLAGAQLHVEVAEDFDVRVRFEEITRDDRVRIENSIDETEFLDQQFDERLLLFGVVSKFFFGFFCANLRHRVQSEITVALEQRLLQRLLQLQVRRVLIDAFQILSQLVVVLLQDQIRRTKQFHCFGIFFERFVVGEIAFLEKIEIDAEAKRRARRSYIHFLEKRLARHLLSVFEQRRWRQRVRNLS